MRLDIPSVIYNITNYYTCGSDMNGSLTANQVKDGSTPSLARCLAFRSLQHIHDNGPRLAGGQMVSYIHPRVGSNSQGDYMIPTQSTNTVVTNNTNFNSRKVKSLRVTTKELFDENGKLVSKETTEEFEYEPEITKVLPQPYHDPYQLLKDQWPHQPVVWSSVGGSYERAGKDTALDLD